MSARTSCSPICNREQRPTGATRPGEDPNRGAEAYDRRSAVQRTWDVIDAVRAVADEVGASMAQGNEQRSSRI